jgi:hypothetical protein
MDIAVKPLLFKTGYTFPLFGGLGLRPEPGMGVLFGKTARYLSAMDMIMGEKQDSPSLSLIATAKPHLVRDVPGGFVSLYAGGGADMIVETGGPIPLAALEAGLSLKPFALVSLMTRRRTPRLPPPREEPAPFVEQPVLPVEEAVPEPPREVYRGTVYFKPDEALPVEPSPPVLDTAGAMAAADPGTRVILRGHSAPAKTPAGQRARFRAEYLMETYALEPSRLSLEWYGAERPPEGEENPSGESRRRVEVIVMTGTVIEEVPLTE